MHALSAEEYLRAGYDSADLWFELSAEIDKFSSHDHHSGQTRANKSHVGAHTSHRRRTPIVEEVRHSKQQTKEAEQISQLVAYGAKGGKQTKNLIITI